MQVSYGQGGKDGGADPAYPPPPGNSQGQAGYGQPPPGYSQPGYSQPQYGQGYSGHSTVVITQPGVVPAGNCPICRVSKKNQTFSFQTHLLILTTFSVQFSLWGYNLCYCGYMCLCTADSF